MPNLVSNSARGSSPHDMPGISIVIVSWNAKHLVQQTLISLQQSCSDLSTEVFVVDNASSDGTPDMVQQEFPDVRLIRCQRNLGFAKANNVAMRLARGKYVCLINSDVTVPPGCLQRMVGYMEQDCSIGMLGPKMLARDGTTGPSCMRRPTLSIWLVHALGLSSFCKNLSLHVTNGDSAGVQEVEVLNGWFWMVRRSALDQVGLLDEQFFMYGEDIDWCHRFWENGWKVVYFPQAAAVHYGAGSSSTMPVRFYVEMQRANLQYWKRHHNRISQFAYILILFLHQIARVLGYGAVFVLKPSVRSDVSDKIKRSAACLCWLFGIRRSQEQTGACQRL
jgi:GT2 family glycosyltransferase